MQPIIEVRSVSKRYRVGATKSYGSLRESLANRFKPRFRASTNMAECETAAESHYWALQDVNFDVQAGEILGLIGSNGAGKSTLMKILSRITAPTSGQVKLFGRVGSLLEVGTGFHPELSGRDNIFLNGAILGMKRIEIANKFEAIVDFSGIEKFIDTPVKRYSSGMYVRLAFAVAAHLQPEIMLIDEVLAVGDAEFQKKCLGKMSDVARTGRTVVFISHNMTAIESLCNRCLLLKGGQIRASGLPSEIINGYMASMIRPESGNASLASHPGRANGTKGAMIWVTLSSEGDEPAAGVRMGATLSVKVVFDSGRRISPVIGIVVKNSQGAAVFGVNNRFIGGYQFHDRVNSGTLTTTLEALPLMPGSYSLDLYLGDGPQDIDVVHDAIYLEVLPADVFGTGQLPPPICGPVFWPATFNLSAKV
jgi:lipopolysaccharide transport system ATP-binding protein